MIVKKWAAGSALAVAAAGGVAAGSVLLGTANAATPTGTTQAGPGVQENDGIPKAQEHHDGRALDLSGTVAAVGSGTVTIRTSTISTVVYTVAASSDIDKNGEAQLSSLVAGDVVRYSVNTGTTTIDKLHAGDEAKNFPTGASAPPVVSGRGTTGADGGVRPARLRARLPTLPEQTNSNRTGAAQVPVAT